jgi:hypothetical protein
LIVTAVEHLDDVFRRHRYRFDSVLCYAKRQAKYGRVWSLHSWAIALDINQDTGNHHAPKFKTTFTPELIADVYKIRHPNGRPVWQWGGMWGVRGGWFDTAHFQLGLSPSEAETMPGPQRPQLLGVPLRPIAGQVLKTEAVVTGPVAVLPSELPPPKPVPSPPSVLEPTVEQRVERLEKRMKRQDEKLEVFAAIVAGAPYYQLAEWMLATVLNRDPSDEEIDVVSARFAAGEKPEAVYWDIRSE